MAPPSGRWALKFPGCCESIPGASHRPFRALPSAIPASMAQHTWSVSAAHAYGEALVSQRVPYGEEKHGATCDGMDVQSHSRAVCDTMWNWRGSREGNACAESPMCRSTGPTVTLGSAPYPAAFLSALVEPSTGDTAPHNL